MRQQIYRVKMLRMFRVALTDYVRNNCHYMSAGIAYWTLFSIFPLTLAAVSLTGYYYTSPEDQAGIVEGVLKIMPVSGEYVQELVADLIQVRGTLGAASIIVLIWVGISVFSAVRKGINHAWHIQQPPNFITERIIDFAMLIGVAALAFVHVLFGSNIIGLKDATASASTSPGWTVVVVLVQLLALAATYGGFTLLYRYAPNTKVEWGDLWLGAMFGATMFQIVRIGFSWYISQYSKFDFVYGSLGAAIALLTWAYLSAVAITWGAQLCYMYRGVFGSHAGEIELKSGRMLRTIKSRNELMVNALHHVQTWKIPSERLKRLDIRRNSED
jgi:membrane protein